MPMALRVEWRTKGETDDAILVVDDAQNAVRQAVEADPTVLRGFLNDMAELHAWRERPSVKDALRNPEAWGHLVMARATTGEVLDMDPELFWDGIYHWFRSRGIDPHVVRR